MHSPVFITEIKLIIVMGIIRKESLYNFPSKSKYLFAYLRVHIDLFEIFSVWLYDHNDTFWLEFTAEKNMERCFCQPLYITFFHISNAYHISIYTLEQRRLFADLIMCYNIVKGNNCIDPSTFFSFPNYKFSRGHPLKISIPLSKLNARKFFFASRVIPAWNSLPETTALAPSTFNFKHHLQHTDFSKFLIFPPAVM